MSTVTIKSSIDNGDVPQLDRLLCNDPSLANTKIIWDGKNKSDPVHYIPDVVFHTGNRTGAETQLAETLIEYGALINGSKDAETPLIGAASLGVAEVGLVLIKAGADIHATSLYGSTALHWSCYTGTTELTEQLIQSGADIEKKCSEFKSTPLFWAIHAMRFGNNKDHSGMISSAQLLIENGADKSTKNFEGYSAYKLARDTGNPEIISLLEP